MYLDIHTHFRKFSPDVVSIYNIILGREEVREVNFDVSVGIHPWYIQEDLIELHLEELRKTAKEENVKLIGEIGLDKVYGGPFDLQLQVFLKQLEIANQLNKPVIIHCVKAFNELIQIVKTRKLNIPMIVHGFNRNESVAKDLIKHGFYLSFGKDLIAKDHVKNAFRICPTDKIFFETDDSDLLEIENIYSKAKEISGIDYKEIILQNYRTLEI